MKLTFSLCLVALGGYGVLPLFGAGPMRPAGDMVLPGIEPIASPQAIVEARARWDRHREDPEAVAGYALELLRADRKEPDERLVEDASTLLDALPESAFEASPSLLLARATLVQRHHRFEEALRDLNRAEALRPRSVPILLTKVTILRLMGRLDEAAPAVLKLYQEASSVISITAAADLASVRGRATEAEALLGPVLEMIDAVEAPVQRWVLTTAAEVAWRAGLRREAERRFRTVLELAPRDLYVLLGLSDLLLEEARHAEVLALADRLPGNNDLRLRRLLALRGMGAAPDEIATVQRALEAQFAVDRTFAFGRHLRTEARYALEVRQDYATALVLARENWAEQKEPVDARLLLAAAEAAGEKDFLASFARELDRIGLATRPLRRALVSR